MGPTSVEEIAQSVAGRTFEHAVQLARQRLHTRLPQFLDALRLEVGAGSKVVLGSDAVWIEDGLPAGDMLEKLLSSPHAKTARDGSRYLTINLMGGRRHPQAPASPHAAIREMPAPRGKGQFVTVSSKRGRWERGAVEPAEVMRDSESFADEETARQLEGWVLEGWV